MDILFNYGASVARQEGERTMPISSPINSWTALGAAVDALMAVAPPVQQHRVRTLCQLAKAQDYIEEAEFLLSVARQLVSLQQRLDRITNDDPEPAA